MSNGGRRNQYNLLFILTRLAYDKRIPFGLRTVKVYIYLLFLFSVMSKFSLDLFHVVLPVQKLFICKQGLALFGLYHILCLYGRYMWLYVLFMVIMKSIFQPSLSFLWRIFYLLKLNVQKTPYLPTP